MASTFLITMPSKIDPSSDFGRQLVKLRKQHGITQVQLAQRIGSTQRAVSRYETIAEFPPVHVLLKIANTFKVSADDLLGLRPPKKSPIPKEDPETKRLWKKFQDVRSLPVKDQRAVIRLINSLVSAKKAS